MDRCFFAIRLSILLLAVTDLFGSTAYSASVPVNEASRKVELLEKVRERDVYISKNETLKALAVLKNYPEDPDSVRNFFDFVARGLPPQLNKKSFLEGYNRLKKVSIVPYFAASRRLIYSAIAYELVGAELDEVSSLIVSRARKTLSRPGTLIDVTLQITLINAAVEKNLIFRDRKKILGEKLEDLLTQAGNTSRLLGDESKTLGTDVAGGFDPDKISRSQLAAAVKIITDESTATESLRKKALAALDER